MHKEYAVISKSHPTEAHRGPFYDRFEVERWICGAIEIGFREDAFYIGVREVSEWCCDETVEELLDRAEKAARFD